jgi:hypothetical protein
LTERQIALAQTFVSHFMATIIIFGRPLIGAGAMGTIVGIVFWILDIRGHIPQFGDYRPIPNGSSSRLDANLVARIVAGLLANVAVPALGFGPPCGLRSG